MKPWVDPRERLVLSIDHAVSDKEVQLVDAGTGGLVLSLEDGYYGDSESGFGACLDCDLGRDDVIAMHEALGEWLARTVPVAPPPGPGPACPWKA